MYLILLFRVREKKRHFNKPLYLQQMIKFFSQRNDLFKNRDCLSLQSPRESCSRNPLGMYLDNLYIYLKHK